jgi:hypothetical protein
MDSTTPDRTLVVCLWFRDGWARAHTNRPRPCLQTHEERLWQRFLIANRRVMSAMQANDVANQPDKKCSCQVCLLSKSIQGIAEKCSGDEKKALETLWSRMEDAETCYGLMEYKVQEGKPFMISGKTYIAKPV